ncbi:MAG: Ppx/GppA phosphatase family protein [Opitutales bacterium]
MSTPCVAVVDIGSNSIKVLVAGPAARGGLQTWLSQTIETRISAGIGAVTPRLTEEGMTRGLGAVGELLAQAAAFDPERVQLVATSAVRAAANRIEFCDRVRNKTGIELRLLSGEEEANLIGRGLTCDPALAAWQDFHLFDLGGGSLECLGFVQRRVRQARSLQLGCVRLTEQFVSDRSQPVDRGVLVALEAQVRRTLRESGFTFAPVAGSLAVGTGGTITTARTILAARRQQTVAESDPRIPVADLQMLLAELASYDLARRRAVPGLTPARADVFPAALATLVAVAGEGGFAAYHHSFYNLRYGVADELLQQ